MKKKHSGIGYVRKSCYYDRKGVARFSVFVQIFDLATKSRGSYFCYKNSRHRYVRKTCYFCYHCYHKVDKGLSSTERSDLVTEVTEIITIPQKVSIDRRIACESKSKNLSCGQNLVTHFVRKNRKKTPYPRGGAMELNDLVIPAPYAVKDGCLGYMKSEKGGEPYFVRLCNFVPFITSQLIVDDGAEVKVRVEIGGFDFRGNPLQTITVPDEKFNSLDWVRNNWGYEFNLETGQTVKDRVRYFLQATAVQAEKKKVYAATGWKQINGQWEFLMPGDEKHTVNLEGRCSNYGFVRDENLDAVIKVMALPYAVAPKEIMFPLVAFAFLSPLTSFLKEAQHEPKTVLMLCGKTGCKKSTLAALICSFFGKFSTTELPLSFRDTANSIIRQSFALKDVLTVIDDYHPSTGKDAAQMNASAQMIFRAYGNRVGRGRLNANSELMTDRIPQGNAIITAEFLPDVGESGTARFITLELGRDDVNNDELSHYQQLAADGVLSSCMYQYTEWIKEKYLTEEKADEKLVSTLASLCKNLRSLLTEKAKEKKIDLRDRLLDDMVSLHVGFSFFCDFLLAKTCIMPEAKPAILEEFDAVILNLAAKQQSHGAGTAHA